MLLLARFEEALEFLSAVGAADAAPNNYRKPVVAQWLRVAKVVRLISVHRDFVNNATSADFI